MNFQLIKHKISNFQKSEILEFERFYPIIQCVWFHVEDNPPLVSYQVCKTFTMSAMVTNAKIKLKSTA